jgi:hypothetical protein
MAVLTEALATCALLGRALLTSLLGGDAAAVGTSRRSDPNVDVAVYLLATAACLVVIVLLRVALVEPLARRWALPAGAAPAKITRFGDSGVELLSYGAFTIVGCMVMSQQPWLWPSSQWWEGQPEGLHAEMRNDLRAWYLLDAARYTAAILSLLFLEKGRKDSKEMLLHHIVTVTITLCSYNIDFTRVGAVVKLLMDPADVPLHAAKLCKYAGREFAADRLFELFAVSFFVMRLVLYGYVVWAATFEVREYTTLPFSGNVCVAGLIVLYGLQVFWFSLVVKVALNISRGGELEDIRSDSEAESDRLINKRD